MASYRCVTFVLALMVFGVFANPKKYPGQEDSFQPSNNRYYEANLNDGTRNGTAKSDKDIKESTAINRFQRFGSLPLPGSGYGNTGSGVHGYPPPPPGGVGYLTPMKIDLGGVALGALLGLGAILIAPKLVHAFHMIGPGYRSLDNNVSSVTDILARIDNSLEVNNIDSSSCMQRIICSYVTDAQKNTKNGEAGTVDQLVLALSGNPVFTYMLDGSAVKQAIDMGKQGDVEKCASLYAKCPIKRESIMQVISSLLPS